MKKNRFSKALKHLKSKKIDDKIKSLEEAGPTNSMSGVYQVTPSTGDAFRMGVGDPDKKFYPKQDGTWPSGIPADASDTVYVRKGGYYDSGKGVVPHNQTPVARDFSYDDVTANGTTNTDTLIRPSDGKPYTSLPEGTESFILGPLVGNYAINHGYDDFTNIGYIQKDTRQFVLLARIQGFFKGEDRRSGNARTFDGTASMFTSYNSNFKLEHALWMQERYNENDFADNFPFNFSGGVPVERHPSNNSMGMGVIMGILNALFGGNSDNIGTPQDPADGKPGFDPGGMDLWGLLHSLLATGADFANNPLKYAVQGLLNLGGNIPGYDSTATSYNNLMHHTKNNNPNHPDFRKNDPSSPNYEGPAPVNTSDENRKNIVNNLNEIISNLNNGNGPTNPNGNLTNDEIKKVSDEMKNKYYNDPRNQAINTFYNSFHSLPVGGDRGDGKPVTTIKVKNGEFEELDSNYWFTDPRDANPLASDEALNVGGTIPSTIISNTIHGVTQQAVENGKWTPGSEGNPFYSDETKTTVIGTQYNTQQSFSAKPPKGNKKEDYILQNKNNLVESKKRILREIRQPLKEIKELPKTTKLKGYRPNFKGKYSPQNTPDVTASKQSDDIVSGKNSSRQIWTAKDKYWKGYETTERMNIIYDNLGHGSQYFDRIVGENVRLKGKKSREVQEHLNMLAHQKAMREVYGIKEYENKIDESETYDNKINDPLFTKVANRLKKEIDYPKKPSPKGYPNEAPPKIDPNTGMHPKFGKRYKYDKLDPISAKTMAGAPTGDPEIDANVKRQAQKEDWRSDLKNLWLGSERGDWKKKIEEDFVNSTQGMKVGQTFTHVPSGQSVTTSGALGGIETVPSTVSIFGDAIPGPNATQYGLQGFAKPIDMMRRGSTKKAEKLNKELDSSEDYTKEVKADEFMKARVKTELSLDQKKEAVKKYKNDLEEWNKKSEARGRENESRRKSNISKVRSFVRKFGENLDDIKGFQTFMKIAEGGKKLIVIHQNNVFRDYSDKFNVTVYEAEEGKIIKKIRGSFGRVDGSKFDNPFTNTKSSGEATIMYDGIGGEVESKNFEIKELPPIPMPEPPEHMKKNLSKGWQPVTKEDEGMINKLNFFFGTSVTGVKFAAKLAIQLAKGDTTPITKSPGVGFDANATRVIHSAIKAALEQNKTSYSNDDTSWYDPKTGTGQVMNNAYTILENPIDNITRAALGKFTFKVTPKGIQVIDTYDISKVTAIGGVSNYLTDFISRIVTAGHGRGTGFTDQFGQNYDAQQTANLITGIAMRRGAELGFDMIDTDGQTIQPIYSMEDAYADSSQLATPKGFNIPINYTMPTGITIKNLLNPRKYTQNKRGSGVQSKSVEKIKSMAKTKRQSLSLDEPIVRRKKKKS